MNESWQVEALVTDSISESYVPIAVSMSGCLQQEDQYGITR